MQEKNSGIGEKERIVEIEVERLREFRGRGGEAQGIQGTSLQGKT